MKNLSDYLRDSIEGMQEPCSEKACANCFANRGCLYEQYLRVVTESNRATIHFNNILPGDIARNGLNAGRNGID